MINLDIKETVLMKGDQEVSVAYLDGVEVYSSGLPVGTVFNFDYTGTVQEVELPRGRYKLQCWGSQGGYSSYGTSASYAGSYGGYSEGILDLKKKTKLYVFVGGNTSVSTAGTLLKGGWNGGGGSIGYSSVGSSSGTSASTGRSRSYPGSGGGGTDIATVTSTMEYSESRTNRSLESLLSRFIVAGGGAGGSSAIYNYTGSSLDVRYPATYCGGSSGLDIDTNHDETPPYIRSYSDKVYLPANSAVYIGVSGSYRIWYQLSTETTNPHREFASYYMFNAPSSGAYVRVYCKLANDEAFTPGNENVLVSYTTSVPINNSIKSTQNSPGGGTIGGGLGGTLTQGGSGSVAGTFGYGANASISSRFISGAGGGGWYGGGSHASDISASMDYGGGGSGFVNIPENASYRPEGYTGLELENGTTIAGNTAFESPSGGTETGHAGNGYAKITVIE